MATISIQVDDATKKLAEKHAVELGFPDAADWAFEWLVNTLEVREQQKATERVRGGFTAPKSKRAAAEEKKRAEEAKAAKPKKAKRG